MAELRKDPVGGRWVIINVDTPKIPSDFAKEEHIPRSGPCPFCYGNEFMTPPEIDAVRHEETHPNTPGWLVRTVANKFPALQIEGDLERRGIGIYDMSNGIGAHEVVIETPYHNKDITDLTDEEVAMSINMYCRRSIDLQKDSRFRYILIFKNRGAIAGASLEHSHTQLIALPMIPKNVLEELSGASTYFEYRERCIFCDIIRQELQEKERILIENKYFVSFCPFVSRFPFEVHIIPKEHASHFCEMNERQRLELAKILRETLLRLKIALDDHSYNFIVHTAPCDKEDHEYYHWHIEIMPRLTGIAGFEWGTGFYAVVTPPEVAIKYLREAKV
ncbi:MAG: galactose-1-phosphate uridylyltransferase [Candidatus Omnitrophica bacterium]|nr:galactose-1-phosphate uridylyltransferase [Candidatus Omnitrophota bacterium]MDD5352432.1 galactose-1-phosphate uridylyltransferase [Candidatus Omnitrophota bacterium]MDD5550030.1 galactose-1-phosphate uridylyltransferase [Candidatus Omnitrophota bacterium]